PRPDSSRASSALRAGLLLPRHLGAFLARLREADGDGLLAALDLLPGFAALELASFHLAHCFVHFVRGLLAVLAGHHAAPARSGLGGRSIRRAGLVNSAFWAANRVPKRP